MKRGQELILRIEKFADRGKSLARVEGYVVFVGGAVPGDQVRVSVLRAKRNYAEARLVEIIEPSDLRTEPQCRYFGNCGGCKWQHVSYDAQCQAKTESVRDALVHTGGFNNPNVLPALQADQIYGYRNKMEFSFGARRWLTDWEIASNEKFDTSFALGLHVPGRFDKLLDIGDCSIQPSKGNELLNCIRNLARVEGWTTWDVRRQVGFLRHLVIRMAARTEEMMVNLVTNGYNEERMQRVVEVLRAETPFVTTAVNTINTGLAQTSFGEETRVLFGPGTITDCIGPFSFQIGPATFFQTNTTQAEHLYEIARSYAALTKEDLVYDLYCGAGTISLYLAEQARQVVGVELVEEAIRNAEANAHLNGAENVTFIAGDLLKTINEAFFKRHGKPDVIVLDPPRAGIHPKVVKRIVQTGAKRIVYVSCNPQTQARDLKLMSERYEVVEVTPVDLFPHTHHVESVAQLRRKA